MSRNLIFFIAFALLLGALSTWLFEEPGTVQASSTPTMREGFFTAPSSTELTAYTISEGRHFCLPRILKSRNRPERVSWIVRFGDNCAYDLGDEDQQDWNKLLGLFFNLLNTRDNTVMVGWRWNLETERMELNAYYHVDGSREFTKPLLDVALGEEVRVDIRVDYEQKNYSVQLERQADGKKAADAKAFRHDNGRCLEINTYFGGNEAAPRDLTIYKGYVP